MYSRTTSELWIRDYICRRGRFLLLPFTRSHQLAWVFRLQLVLVLHLHLLEFNDTATQTDDTHTSSTHSYIKFRVTWAFKKGDFPTERKRIELIKLNFKSFTILPHSIFHNFFFLPFFFNFFLFFILFH